MTQLVLANLDRGFFDQSGHVDEHRLANQFDQLAQAGFKIGVATRLPYAKVLTSLHGIKTPFAAICEGGAQVVDRKVIRDENTIDYSIWHAGLEFFQSDRDFNTASIVLSGKMNAYTDATEGGAADQRFQLAYPSLYHLQNLATVADAVYQIRLDFSADDIDMHNREQTFNDHFNGKLHAKAVDRQLYVVAEGVAIQSAAEELASDLDVAEADVEWVGGTSDARLAVLDDAPSAGYAGLDQLLTD